MTTQKTGKLFLIPTVIAEDTAFQVLSPQVLEVCRHTKYFLVENARTTRRFISSLQLGVVIEDLKLQELNKDTPDGAVNQMLKPLLEGYDIGIISEAGCPGVADPGARAVAWAHQHCVQVVPLVGPSSILLALMASGFSGQRFAFHGYIPIKGTPRLQAIRQLEKAIGTGQSQIFMETPYRNNQLLDDIIKNCNPATELCIAKNITGKDELVRTQAIKDWKKEKIDLHKQPTIFILGKSKY